MKLKVTKKEIRQSNQKVYSVGYCHFQNLLEQENPFAYSAGVYGWACDYYEINGVIFSTGYQPIGESIPHDLVVKYEKLAQQVYYDYPDWTSRAIKKRNLILQLIKELKGEE